MRIEYEAFVRTKTTNSDWATFVVPEPMRSSSWYVDALSDLISCIISDSQANYNQPEISGRYFFPLRELLVYMEVRRTQYKDTNARAIWTSIGGVFASRDRAKVIAGLVEILKDKEFFRRVEQRYVNHEGFAPEHPHISAVFQVETGSLFSKQLATQASSYRRPDAFHEDTHLTKRISESITLIPYNDASFREFTESLEGTDRYILSKEAFFVFGPGYRWFTNESWDRNIPHCARLKMYPEELTHTLPPPPQQRIPQKLISNMEICEVKESYGGFFGIGIFSPHQSGRYVAELKSSKTGTKVLFESSDLTSIGEYLEKRGWRTDIDWRGQPVFPQTWYRSIPGEWRPSSY